MVGRCVSVSLRFLARASESCYNEDHSDIPGFDSVRVLRTVLFHNLPTEDASKPRNHILLPTRHAMNDEGNHEDIPKDFAQLMLMSDAAEDCFRGAFLLVAQDDSKNWRWYDADLFDDLDHLKRFIDVKLREEYGIGEYMLMLCSVTHSLMVPAVNCDSN